uniref:Uncharacterized protein n=1 Tax=Arundo donax TaxID=35708 RepID=A0A0A9HAF0_ARUDO
MSHHPSEYNIYCMFITCVWLRDGWQRTSPRNSKVNLSFYILLILY